MFFFLVSFNIILLLTKPSSLRRCSSLLYYRPQRSCGKVMFLHLCVILFTGGLCPVGVSVQGDLCPEVLYPGGSLSRGSLSESLCPGDPSLSRGCVCLGGVSVHGGCLCPGWSLSKGRGSLSGRHPYGNVRAVRILLECILV